MAEVAPISNNNRLFNNNNDNGYIESTRVSYYARALRKIAFALSVSTLTVLIGVLIILVAFPFRHKWEAKEDTIFFIEWMSATVVVCLINVLAEVPSFLTIIADFTFTWAIISCLIGFMNEFPHYEWCYDWGMAIPVHPRCVQWRLVVTILMGISSGFAIILGAIFVLLLLCRIYAIMTSKYWKKVSMRLPTGEISWTISLKFTRNDNGPSEGLIREARSTPTSQGPVHI